MRSGNFRRSGPVFPFSMAARKPARSILADPCSKITSPRTSWPAPPARVMKFGLSRFRESADCKICVTAEGLPNSSSVCSSRDRMKRWWSILLVAAASVATALGADGKKSSGADALFNESRIRTFKMETPPASLAALKQDSHGYVRATVQEGDVTLHDVGIRLKGHG